MTSIDPQATPSPSSNRSRRPIRPSDLHAIRSVSDVAIHPDGTIAVCTVGWPDEVTDSNRAQFHVVDLTDGSRRQLTYGHSDTRARFSSDGRRLAFVRTDSDSNRSVMILDWETNELTEAVRFPHGIVDVSWVDGERLVVLAPQRPEGQRGIDDAELGRRPRVEHRIDYRFNGRGYTSDRRVQLYRLDPTATATGSDAPGRDETDGDPIAGSHRATAIGVAGADHAAMAVAPDRGSIAVAVSTDDDTEFTGANRVWTIPLTIEPDDPAHQTGAVRLTGPGGRWNGLIWHDGGALVGIGSEDLTHVGFDRPQVIPTDPTAGDGTGIRVIGPHDVNTASSLFAAGNAIAPTEAGIMALGFRRGRVTIDEYDLATGALHTVHEADEQVVAFDGTADGSVLVAAVTSPLRPAELWRLGAEPIRLVGLNDDLLEQLDLAETESVMVPSTEGAEVHALVTRPPASAPDTGERRPGLIYVHGGPLSQYGYGFFDEFQMAAAAGYVVVAGNPRGSDGYGEEWARAIVGDLGGRDWADVSALTDHLCGLDEVDEGRVGIGGGSYGGFMTGWALARDERYRAGLVERAVTSWTTMFGTSDIGNWFTERTIGASIESDPTEVARQSPITYAADITAPTLILHSEHDWRCPIEQAEQLFAAIRRNGGDATMVRFPNENHELSRSGSPRHRVERFEIVHEFFATHLGGADFGTTHLAPPYTAH